LGSIEELLADLPVYVDNSLLPYFPPIRDQGVLGSGASFSTTYYQLSYMTALQRGLDIRNPGDNTNKYSPKWSYNMLNDGSDGGTSLFENHKLLEKHGAATWAEFPYDSNYRAWCLNTGAWRNALGARTKTPQYSLYADTDAGLAVIKQLLVNGYILTFGTHIYSWQNVIIQDDPSTIFDDGAVGKFSCSWMNGTSGAHAMTIVGYNDAIWTDINGNSVIDPGEKGALRIANSWGTGWNSADGGFIWLAYDALKDPSAVTGGPSTGRVSAIADNMVFVLTARDGYSPALIAEFTVNHARRNQLTMLVGHSDTTATEPATTWTPLALAQQGGAYAFNGTTSAVDGTFVLDCTDILPPGGVSRRLFLGMIDSTAGHIATLSTFKVIDTTTDPDTEVVSGLVPRTADAATAYSYVEYTYNGPSHNNPPAVYNGKVLPESGSTIDDFQFFVWYYDADGNLPSVKNVYIDGNPYAMTYYPGAGSASASDGWYMFQTNLSAGAHSYRYDFADGQGGSSQDPVSVRPPPYNTYPGPAVIFSHLVSTPDAPWGEQNLAVGQSSSFVTGGSFCGVGHAIQYRFDWGNGTLSDWLAVGVTSAVHAWSGPGVYEVRAQARCAVDNMIESSWSGVLTVNIWGSVLLEEDFVDATGWTQQNVGTGGSNLWSLVTTNLAGGAPGEMRCQWYNVNPGTTRFISPAINPFGFSTLRLSFKHFFDAYGSGACTIKIQTSTDLSSWTDQVWSIVSPTVNLGPETVMTTLTHDPAVGTLYVAFVITGDLYEFDYWHIDDVKIVSAVSPDNWSALGGGTNGEVRAILNVGSDVYVGGEFTTAGETAVNHIAKWDGTSWSALGTGLNNRVYALAYMDGNLYAGGDFTTAGGVTANYIARWNGSSWSSVGTGLNGTVHSLLASDSILYATGSFTTAGGGAASRIARWNGTSWSALGTGIDSTGYALKMMYGILYVGGNLNYAGGVAANFIAKWNGSSWSACGSGTNGAVLSLEVDGSTMIAGGAFTTAGGVSANRIATWNGTSWSALGSGLNLSVYSLKKGTTYLFAGGNFTSAGGSEAQHIARWDGSTWSSVGAGLDHYVRAIAATPSTLYVGGLFTSYIVSYPLTATVTTTAITSITQTSAVSGGNVMSDWGATVTARGVCWNTTGTPTVADAHTTDGSGTGTFESNITGLTQATVYYVRAYATNSIGVGYGATQRFTTLSPVSPDLIVESLTLAPPFPMPGDNIWFTAVIKNIGTGPAAASVLKIWVGGESDGTDHAITALNPGEFAEVTRNVSLPVGAYRTTAQADYPGLLAESNEANNQNFVDFNVIAADQVAHKLVYSSDETGNGEIFVIALNSDLDVLYKYNATNRASGEGYPRWSPSGDMIAFQSDYDGSGQTWVMNADGSNKRRVTNESLAVAPICWSNDGQYIYALMANPGDGEVVQVNVETGAVTVLTSVPGYNTQHWDLNSDQSKIAYVRGVQGNGFSNQLYVADFAFSGSDFTNRVLLPDAVPAPHSPRFSPSGTRIAVHLDRISPWGEGIGIIGADGSGFWTPIPVEGYVNQTPEWVDENRIIYAHGTNSSILYALNLNDLTQKQITSGSGYQGFPDIFSYAAPPQPYSRKVDFNNDGQEDILWRYYGSGGYQGLNLVWLLGQAGQPAPMASVAGQGQANIDSILTGSAANMASEICQKPIESILAGRRSAAFAPRLTIKDPISAGLGKPFPKRDEGSISASRKALKRTDAADPASLDPDEVKLAAISVAQEVIISQVADTAWEIAGTGDFNGDGKTDILWRYYGTGGYQGLNDIWFMDGTTFIGESVFSQIPDLNWRIAGTGDFNGDGKTDILWRYHGTGAYQGLNVIWYMNGSQFAGETVFSQVLDIDWRIEGTGDFNGDGETDILWRYYGIGDYQGLNDIWFMNDATFVSETVFSQILDTGWQVGGTGDFNNDGQTDILWRYYGTGAYQGLNDIWYMNGTAFVSEEVFSVIPDTNWRIVNR
jgi:hypothetical protein